MKNELSDLVRLLPEDADPSLFEVRKQFGRSVKKWRNRLGISQEELARRAGLNRCYLSDVERGARNPSLVNIEKLACSLEIETPLLLSYDAPTEGAADIQIDRGLKMASNKITENFARPATLGY